VGVVRLQQAPLEGTALTEESGFGSRYVSGQNTGIAEDEEPTLLAQLIAYPGVARVRA
jgi:hypothetical protein